ncbi:MAG: hypothetical protein K2P39_14565 [Lachnospiraceae bacterium]|nr:hypothetical protein [Lachnospiraceae bacterium]
MLNKKGQRELAYVVKIDGICAIEGADRVEVAQVGGWRIMVRKGQFVPGDLAVYFEIDSRVPEREPFLFLESKHYRIKTQKYFKGTVISQGLLMAAEDFGWEKDALKPGDFLTEKLGVTYAVEEDNVRKSASADQYKRMASRHPKLFQTRAVRWLWQRVWGRKLLFVLLGKKQDKKSAWPSWVTRTDEERVQNIPGVLANKSEWVATEKIDGTSTTATLRRRGKKKYDFYICSRNVVFDRPDRKTYYDFNVYTEMAEKYHFEETLKAIADRYGLEWVTLQGESFGAGVQKRDYGLKERDFMGFNLIFSDRGRLGSREAADIMKEYGIAWVPIVDEHFILPDTVEELLQTAAGKSAIDGGMREGLVLRAKDGSRSFKAVSNEFLLKYHT